jgi:hypothetical protein
VWSCDRSVFKSKVNCARIVLQSAPHISFLQFLRRLFVAWIPSKTRRPERFLFQLNRFGLAYRLSSLHSNVHHRISRRPNAPMISPVRVLGLPAFSVALNGKPRLVCHAKRAAECRFARYKKPFASQSFYGRVVWVPRSFSSDAAATSLQFNGKSTADDIASSVDLTGKVAIITGANSGSLFLQAARKCRC